MMENLETSQPLMRSVIKYTINSKRSRTLLVLDLKATVKFAFEDLSESNHKLHAELPYLNECISLINKEVPDIMLVRHKKLQPALYEFFELMAYIKFYSAQSKFSSDERKLVKSLRKLIVNFNNVTNLRLTTSEEYALERIKKSDLSLYVLYINLKRIPSEFVPYFHRSYPEFPTNEVDTALPVVVTPPLVQSNPEEALLESINTELLQAYRQANEVIREAKAVTALPEDRHFIEQVTADYYPHIFQLLRGVMTNTATLAHKEAAVKEGLKQFNIIQLGLTEIIENTIVRSLNESKAQTGFLESKVLGSQALSLSPDETSTIVEANVEEAKRMREELYRQHVAPMIEQLRSEYEEKLAALQASHDEDMKRLAVENWNYKQQLNHWRTEEAPF